MLISENRFSIVRYNDTTEFFLLSSKFETFLVFHNIRLKVTQLNIINKYLHHLKRSRKDSKKVMNARVLKLHLRTQCCISSNFPFNSVPKTVFHLQLFVIPLSELPKIQIAYVSGLRRKQNMRGSTESYNELRLASKMKWKWTLKGNSLCTRFGTLNFANFLISVVVIF